MRADPECALLGASLAFAGAAVLGSVVAVRDQLPGEPLGGEYRAVGSGRAAGRMGGRGRRAVADAGGSCHDGGQGPAPRAGH
jgi:hypothetical protein